MHFLLFYDLVPDYMERRAAYRDAHLRLAWEAHARGELVLGGALEPAREGAVLLFQGDSPEVAARFAAQDPYVKNGLVSSWRVHRWVTVAGDGAEAPTRPAP
ncbi:MAG: YciI family protein [Acidobacteria bacterium]|nr:YciI family protein [Acidobacteriota bacterium]